MSIQAMTWAFGLQLDPRDKLVLLALADQANDAGLCWPSQDVIATKASCSVRGVRRAIETLRRADLLSIEHRGNDGYGKGRKTNSYHLNVGADFSPDSTSAAESDEPVENFDETGTFPRNLNNGSDWPVNIDDPVENFDETGTFPRNLNNGSDWPVNQNDVDLPATAGRQIRPTPYLKTINLKPIPTNQANVKGREGGLVGVDGVEDFSEASGEGLAGCVVAAGLALTDPVADSSSPLMTPDSPVDDSKGVSSDFQGVTHDLIGASSVCASKRPPVGSEGGLVGVDGVATTQDEVSAAGSVSVAGDCPDWGLLGACLPPDFLGLLSSSAGLVVTGLLREAVEAGWDEREILKRLSANSLPLEVSNGSGLVIYRLRDVLAAPVPGSVKPSAGSKQRRHEEWLRTETKAILAGVSKLDLKAQECILANYQGVLDRESALVGSPSVVSAEVQAEFEEISQKAREIRDALDAQAEQQRRERAQRPKKPGLVFLEGKFEVT